MNKTQKLYDVCNDYSLDECTDQGKDLSGYRAVKQKSGTLYYHKEYRELHYFRGPDGLNGKYI